jgi:hypothetical protein
MDAAPIEDYLAEVAAALPGAPKIRADIVAELRSGLLDAVDAHLAAGLSTEAASLAAVAEFGDSRTATALLAPECAALQARRLSVSLAATAAPIGALWAFAAQASHGGRHTAPRQWITAPPMPLTLAACVIVLTTALATVAATGRLTRRLSDRPGAAAISAAIGGFGASAVDLAIFTALAHQLVTAPDTLAPLPVTLAATATLTRLTLAHRTARQCLAARAALASTAG